MLKNIKNIFAAPDFGNHTILKITSDIIQHTEVIGTNSIESFYGSLEEYSTKDNNDDINSICVISVDDLSVHQHDYEVTLELAECEPPAYCVERTDFLIIIDGAYGEQIIIKDSSTTLDDDRFDSFNDLKARFDSMPKLP